MTVGDFRFRRPLELKAKIYHFGRDFAGRVRHLSERQSFRTYGSSPAYKRSRLDRLSESNQRAVGGSFVLSLQRGRRPLPEDGSRHSVRSDLSIAARFSVSPALRE